MLKGVKRPGQQPNRPGKRMKTQEFPTIRIHSQQIFDAEEISGVFAQWLVHDTPDGESRSCNLRTGEMFDFAQEGIVSGAIDDHIFVRKRNSLMKTQFDQNTEEEITPSWFDGDVGYCRIFKHNGELKILFELQSESKICVANLQDGNREEIGLLCEMTNFGAWGKVQLHYDCRFVVMGERFFFQSEFKIAECLFTEKEVRRIPCFDGTAALLNVNNTLFSFQCKSLSSERPEKYANDMKLIDEFHNQYEVHFTGTNPCFSGYLVNVQLDNDFFVLAEDGVHRLTVFFPFLQNKNLSTSWAVDDAVFDQITPVRLKCNGGEVCIPKEWLISRCPYFDGLLRHDNVEASSNSFNFEDISRNTMQIFCKWIYTNEVCVTNAHECLELFCLSNRLLCDELTLRTGNQIDKYVTKQNVAAILHSISELNGKHFTHLHDYLFKLYIDHPELCVNKLNRGRTNEKIQQIAMWNQVAHNEKYMKPP